MLVQDLQAVQANIEEVAPTVSDVQEDDLTLDALLLGAFFLFYRCKLSGFRLAHAIRLGSSLVRIVADSLTLNDRRGLWPLVEEGSRL